MDVYLYCLYSLHDWTVGLAERSILVQEVVLQEHMFQICYNSHENSKYILIFKNENHIYMSLSELMLPWNPSKENTSFINKPLGLSHVWNHIVDSIKLRFLIEIAWLWDKFPKRRPWNLPMPFSSDKQGFFVHELFPQFWRYPYENCDTRLKTGSVTANAGRVGITFRCLATVSQMSWIIGKCTIISLKVLNLYI